MQGQRSLSLRLNREILRLSIPAIVSNVTVPLLGLCDTGISGHLGSEIYLAAIAVGSVMLNAVYWLFGFLRMGTTGLAAEALGRGDEKAICRVFSRSLLLAFICGVVLIILSVPLRNLLFYIISPETEVRLSAASYFQICIIGAPALLGVAAVNGWLVGMQTTAYPMIISIIINVVNIAASMIAVFVIKTGFIGIAYGTAIANWIGLGVALYCCVLFRKGGLPLCSWREVIAGGGIKKYFSVNSNLFIRSLCIIAVTMGMTSAAAGLGTMLLAVNVIMMQFFQLFSFFMDGFAFAGEAMTGLHAGERDLFLLHKSVVMLLKWTLGLAIAFALLYFFFGDAICGILTDVGVVRESFRTMGLILFLMPLVSCWAFIFDGFYVGLTKTRMMMFSTLIGAVVFFMFAFYCSDMKETYSGLYPLWTGFLCYLGLRGLFLALLWNKMEKQVGQ